MIKNIRTAVLFSSLVLLSMLSYAEYPSNAVYIAGNKAIGVILAHGRGKHPTWKVVNPLRKGINEQLDYHTLSIQMPNEDKHWKKYADDFPDAYSRIKQAVTFLKQQANVDKVYLIGHSMGSRMAGAYLNETANHAIDGLIIAGCRNNGGYPFNCLKNVENLELPILDIWGHGNQKDRRAGKERKRLQSDAYTQVSIPGANHKFDEHDGELVSAVNNWLESQQ